MNQALYEEAMQRAADQDARRQAQVERQIASINRLLAERDIYRHALTTYAFETDTDKLGPQIATQALKDGVDTETKEVKPS